MPPNSPPAWSRLRWVLLAIALGGVLGACARRALELAWPTPDGGFPWATFVTNASGCLLIGILMVHVVEVGGAHPLLRPFVGVGVLGGFTTFSTYAVQAVLLADGHPAMAAAYVVATPVVALMAVTAGVVAARAPTRLTRRLARRDDVPETTPSDLAEDQR